MADLTQVDEELDALYGMRPGEFVPARDRLAKRLRAAGQRAEADAVKALARPTVAAWAVNQLSRVDPEATQALADAGRRLEEAQAALLEHGDRDGWRAATAAQREAVERLLAVAERVLTEERGSVAPGLREQVRGTLQAAAVDAEAREAVSRGRLARELQASGLLGADASATAAAPARRPAAPAPKAARAPKAAEPPEPSASAAAERSARARRRAAEREARAALRRAERLVTAARAAAERAGKARGRAQKAHDAAAAALEDAQAAEQQRADELDVAARSAEDAEAALAERVDAERAAREALEALDDD